MRRVKQGVRPLRRAHSSAGGGGRSRRKERRHQLNSKRWGGAHALGSKRQLSGIQELVV